MTSSVEEANYDAAMKLPDGVTCDACVHSRRCFAFGFSTSGAKHCDFYPSRYRVHILPASPTPKE